MKSKEKDGADLLQTQKLFDKEKLLGAVDQAASKLLQRLELQGSLCRSRVYNWFLMRRTLHTLRVRVMQQLLLKDLASRVGRRTRSYLESLSFLILKRNLLHVHQVRAFKARGSLATKQAVLFELVQHRKMKRFMRQQTELAVGYRDFKLRQLALKSLGMNCHSYAYFPDGRINFNVVIPSDFEIAHVLAKATDFRN